MGITTETPNPDRSWDFRNASGPKINQIFIDNWSVPYPTWGDGTSLNINEIQVWVNGENIAYYINSGIHGTYMIRGNISSDNEPIDNPYADVVSIDILVELIITI